MLPLRCGIIVLTVAATSSLKLNGAASMSIRPASIFEKSRTSSMMRSRP